MPNRPFRFAVTHASIATVPTDETDFTATVERHRSELHRHCVRLLGSHADADDALQETLLRAWRARRTQTAGSPRGWLYAIATNACYDVIAHRAPAVAFDGAGHWVHHDRLDAFLAEVRAFL